MTTTMQVSNNNNNNSRSSSSGYKMTKSLGSAITLLVASSGIAVLSSHSHVTKTANPASRMLSVPSVTVPALTTSNSNNDNDDKFVCRLTKQLSLSTSMVMQEQAPLICVTIVNGEEHADFVLDEYLMRHLYDQHSFQEDVFVSMTGVALEEKTGTLTGNANTVITVVDAPLQHARRVTEASRGNYTLAVIRVSTRDSEMIISAKELSDAILSDSEGAVNVITQYRAISFGQFQLQSVGVYEVFVNENISEYPGMDSMFKAINKAAIQQLNITNLSALADKVMICHPPGHTVGTMAFTHHLGWRAHYNNGFCASMSAA